LHRPIALVLVGLLCGAPALADPAEGAGVTQAAVATAPAELPAASEPAGGLAPVPATEPSEAASASEAAARAAVPAADPNDIASASDAALFADDGDDAEFDAEFEPPAPDPMERLNRRIFGANRAVDRTVLDPLCRVYGRVVPDVAKRAIRGVFQNLSEPAVAVNDLLQGHGRRAGSAGGRFLINTTVGVAGVWDPARRIGLTYHHADFGQTLGKAGVGPGMYVMLPLLGPTTVRDAIGGVVDLTLQPQTWLLPVGGWIATGATEGIATKEAYLDQIDALERSSIDFYASMRSAYLMSREALIRDEPKAANAAVTQGTLSSP
jgi:phospholipid-binding lipoprotein MlaA